MKKILIVETNTDKYEKHDIKTGLWLGELTHFYEEIIAAGYKVDFLSPKGGKVPIDPFSMKFAKDSDKKWLENENFKNKALENTKKPSEINPNEYQAIYYTGGHGVLWDFVNNKEIDAIAEKIYSNGGYVTSVCHGAVGLLDLKDDKGNYLIENKNITGFTNTEEILSARAKKVPFSTEDALKSRNSNYKKKRFFKSYAIRDGRLITGQNPCSPREVGKILVDALGGDK